MSRFIIECPACHQYAEAGEDFRDNRSVRCACGHVIDVKAEDMTARVCPSCGSSVIYARSEDTAAECPRCHAALEDGRGLARVRCTACGCLLLAEKNAATVTCPICDTAADVKANAQAGAAGRKRGIILGVLAAAVILAAFLVITQVIIPGNQYRDAVALQQAGKYEEAIAAFEALGNSPDAAAQISETRYLQGKALTASGNYAEALSVFNSIKGYKDVDSLVKSNQDFAAAAEAREEKLKLFRTVGSYVDFGTYPQTAAGDDKTPIEWLVLDVEGNKSLLISRYGLDVKPYHTQWIEMTWEKCSMRSWLNSDFLTKAFSANEQKAILTTAVDNSGSQGYSEWSTSGGNDTQDRIFLLSYGEASKYFGVTFENSNNMKARVAPTAYAIKHGAYTFSSYKNADGEEAGWWWLRSPGNYMDFGADVSMDGSLNYYYVTYDHGCVRPALWVDLESSFFRN